MRFFLLFTSLFVIACAQSPQAKTNKKVEQDLTIGVNLKANRYSDIYFSGQPSLLDIRNLKKQGFTHIINFRDSSEHDEAAERKLVQSLGMEYSQIPFKGKNPLTDEYINSVTQSVKAHRSKGKTLIHCGSGNRVGVWVGGHFYKDHKYSKKQSVIMAQQMGLKHEKPLKKLQEYLNTK